MEWLLLRGLAREQRHWGSFPAEFSRLVPGARTHTLDLPGAGTQHRHRCPSEMSALVEDVRRRFIPLAEEHRGPWGILGISLGAMVALEWTARHPTDFARAVVANTSVRSLSPPWERMRPRALRHVLAALLERDPERRELRILGATTLLHRDLDATAKRWASYATDQPMRRAAVVSQLLAAMRFAGPERIDVPLLVLGAANDPLTHPRCPERIAARLGAPFALHPTAGHDLSLDDGPWIAEQVRAWIEAVP
jgi:pimeloyl-ACP methyl ester carboxylesterase